MKKLEVILITGGSCSGKSEFIKWFRNAIIIEQDSFYKSISEMEKNSEGKYDFDNPDAMNIQDCADAVKELLTTGKTHIPVYDMLTSTKTGEREVTIHEDTQFIVVEGIYSFYPPLIDLASMKIFLDTPMEIRVARRMLRDIERKGRTKVEILTDFIHVEKSYAKYVEPMKKHADLVIPFSLSPLQFT